MASSCRPFDCAQGRRGAALVVATLAIFLAWVATPRAGGYRHSHAGGERAHVHAYATSGSDHHHHHGVDHHHHRHHHHHRAEAAKAPQAGPGLSAVAGGGDHWHSQTYVQRAVPASSPEVVVTSLVAPVPSAASGSVRHRQPLTAQPRAPPFPAGS